MADTLEVCHARPWSEYENVGVLDRIKAGISGEAVIRGGYTVKPNLQWLATDLKKAVGVTDFGTYPGHSPPEGPTQAFDCFNEVSSYGYVIQDRVCDFAFKHAKKYGVRYCIRRHQIRNVERWDEGWRDQGVTGNPTADHLDHTHVTCYEHGEIEVPEPSPIVAIGDDMFTYSTHRNVDGGSIWFVFNGKAHRLHLPSDAEKIENAGVLGLGEMSQSFHNLFEHVG